MSKNDEFTWTSTTIGKLGFEICLTKLCLQTNGAVVNTGSTCGCGSTICDRTTGMVCFASQNRCAIGPTCLNNNGVSINANDCTCGSSACDVSTGFFCYASQNRCAVGPPCSNNIGVSINANDCACGSSDCDSTTGRFCLASGNTCAATTIADKFQVTAGSCTTSESCFQSPNYPSNYGKKNACTIKVLNVLGSEKLFSEKFYTQGSGDKLIIGGTEYYQTSSASPNTIVDDISSFPNHIVVSTNDEILWVSDYSVTGGTDVKPYGFKICLIVECSHKNGHIENTGSPTCGCGSTICDATSGMFCFGSKCAATKIGDDDKFVVISGTGCTTSGSCFQSVNYPNSYTVGRKNFYSGASNEGSGGWPSYGNACTIKVKSSLVGETLNTIYFKTLARHHSLVINGKTYSGETSSTISPGTGTGDGIYGGGGPYNVTVSVNDEITWSHSTFLSSGGRFKVCMLPQCSETGANSNTCVCGDGSDIRNSVPYVREENYKLNNLGIAFCGLKLLLTGLVTGSFCKASTNTCSLYPPCEASKWSLTGDWNELTASCTLRDTIEIGSGQTLKIRKHPSMTTELVVDRSGKGILTGYMGSDGTHFSVNTDGALYVEGVTLTGGYFSGAGGVVRVLLSFFYFFDHPFYFLLVLFSFFFITHLR